MNVEDVVSIIQEELQKAVPRITAQGGVTMSHYDMRAVEYNLRDHVLAKEKEVQSILETKGVDRDVISNNITELISSAVVQAKKDNRNEIRAADVTLTLWNWIKLRFGLGLSVVRLINHIERSR